MNRGTRSRHRGERGLTLIELVVAMSVFALVAVMGLQSLSGMLRQRDRAAEFAEASAALGRAAGLIRQDLGAAMPMLFYPPGAASQSALVEVSGGNGFAVTVANTRPYGPLGASGLAGRVEYRLEAETGRLLRRAWSTAWPASDAARGGEMAVLTGVTGLRLRSYWTGVGWIDGLRFAALDDAPRGPGASGQDRPEAARETYSDILPQAIEITLVTERFGEITVLESPV